MDVSKLFGRAESAIERNNLDYAEDLFQQILTIEPNFVVARRAIRGIQRRRVQENSFSLPGQIIGTLKGTPSLVKIMIFRLTGNYDGMMVECEKFLGGYPTNMFVLSCLANAGNRAGYTDSSIACYEAMVEQQASNLLALKSLGRLYAAKGDVKKAQHYYDEVRKYNPSDMEADRAVKDLAALGTIKDGWDQAGSYRDLVKDEGEAQKLEQEQRIVRTADDVKDAIKRVRDELEKTPDQPRILVQLGDLLARGGKFAEAEDSYKKAAEIDSADATIPTKLGDLEIRRMAVDVKKLQAKLAKNPKDNSVKQALVAKQKKKLQFTLKEYARRVASHPTDLGLKLDYGKFLYKAEKFDEAISEFQRAVDSPKYKKAAINLMGQSFMKKGMHDLAIAQFEKAVADISVMDDDAKNILYNLGNANEQLGELDKAQEFYKRIYETDIGFKDVSEKMESMYRKTKGKKEADANK